MLCSEHSLVSEEGGIAVTLRCKRWSCDICRPFNRRALVKRAIEGGPTLFITLTANPHRRSSPSSRARGLVDAWRTICRRLRNSYRLPSVPFLAIFEATKRGEPHLHIFVRLPFLPQRWLSEQMRALEGAPIVHVRRIEDAGRAARYAAKQPYRFKGTKRFWTSLDWLTERLASSFSGVGRWVKRLCSLDVIEQEFRTNGVSYLRSLHRLTWGDLPP